MDADYAAAYPQLYRRHWWWRVREEILLRKIRAILAPARRARILDVGCGAALFFDALAEFGDVEGIESDRASAERAGPWQSRIVIGELDASYAPAAPFDLILMLDVLEHSREPERVLRRAGELLTARGRILITVPAFNWLWTAHDDMNHHVTRYSAASMGRTIQGAGLTMLESSYLFQSLVVPKLLVRLKETVTPRKPRVPAIPAPAINEAVQAWFRGEHRVAGWLPFGSSLLATVARSAD